MSKYGVFSGPNAGKYGPEKTPHLDTFHALLWKYLSLSNAEAYSEPSQTSKKELFTKKVNSFQPKLNLKA